jgi:hypothetical protein
LKSIALPRVAMGVSFQKKKTGKRKKLVKIRPIYVLYQFCIFSSNADGGIGISDFGVLISEWVRK